MEIVGGTYIYIYIKLYFLRFFFSPTPRFLATTPTTTHTHQGKGIGGNETRCSDGVYERCIYILTPPVNLGRYLLHAYRRERESL